MQLFSLGGGEFVQKVFMRVEAHASILQLMNVGKCFLSEVFSEGEGVHGLGEFLVCEKENKTS